MTREVKRDEVPTNGQEPIPGTPPNYPNTPHIQLWRGGAFFGTPQKQAILGPYGVLRLSDRMRV